MYAIKSFVWFCAIVLVCAGAVWVTAPEEPDAKAELFNNGYLTVAPGYSDCHTCDPTPELQFIPCG